VDHPAAHRDRHLADRRVQTDRLEAGTVWVNCWMVRDLRVPFGGMKSSGVGREGGVEALRFFTEAKNVCVQVPQ
jgi:acyl-CoA reductase-like NAD-dependent aldehyde dehydrogenase